MTLKICNWQQTQTNESLQNLKEHHHFDVMVADTGVAHINCLMCKKKFQLGTKKSKFLISNWSRASNNPLTAPLKRP